MSAVVFVGIGIHIVQGRLLVGFSRTDVHGAWEVPALPRGQRYPAAGMSQGYRPSLLTITLSAQDPPVVQLNPIMMSR